MTSDRETVPADPDSPTCGGKLPDTGDTAGSKPPHVEEAPALFRVEAGNPSPEDLAVLTLVLAAAASGDDEQPAPKPVSGWASPRMRSIGHPGVGAWRAEAFGR